MVFMNPLFIPSRQGPLFALYFQPVDGKPSKAILHVPAFGEEMNKSRRMVALQARAYAEQGYAVLMVDLFGTGDSAGDFGEATWEIWLENLETAAEWLEQQGMQQLNLWGLRSGALLAMAFGARRRIEHMLCWQPVLNGDSFMTQFLRLRIAAKLLDKQGPREKTAELKQRLQAGETLEVAGYHLNPALANPFMALRSENLPPMRLKELAIFEILSNEKTPLSAGYGQFLEQQRAQGQNASLTRAYGEPFWASQEISAAPNLIKLSTEKVRQWR